MARSYPGSDQDVCGCRLSGAPREKMKMRVLPLSGWHWTRESINVPVEKFARLTGRSLAGFKRDFFKTFGMPPRQWLQERRLMEARHLIEKKNKKPSSISIWGLRVCRISRILLRRSSVRRLRGECVVRICTLVAIFGYDKTFPLLVISMPCLLGRRANTDDAARDTEDL